MLINSETQLLLIAATLACLVLGFVILILRRVANRKAICQKTKERLAKQSFRVRKSDLLSVSGRQKRNSNKNKPRRWYNKRVIGESYQSTTWLDRIVALKEYFLLRDRFASQEVPAAPTYRSRLPPKINMGDYYSNVKVVGLDCEMVGGGKGGMKSLLARCSVVTLDCIPIHGDEAANESKLDNINQNLVILYDKYVIPKARITDYRTQWSGITKETYDGNTHNVPIIAFYQCQKEITELFSSIDGMSVVVVGHALENDFDALKIKHPDALTRDTSLYGPYMRQVRRRLFPRKLSTLTSEELGIEIQQEPDLVEQTESCHNTTNEYNTSIGHSSVEDAAAALRLYWHKCQDWERSMRYPLHISAGLNAGVRKWPPLKIYLDCCNLPLGLRGVDFKALLRTDEKENSDRVIESKSVRLISRNTAVQMSTSVSGAVDWIPYFRSALLPGATPGIETFVVMFDGAKFRDITKSRVGAKIRTRGHSHQTKCFKLESPKHHGSIAIEITEDGDSADDVLYSQCKHYSSDVGDAPLGRIISLNQAADIFSSQGNDNDILGSYVVIRRKAGGSKTHRRLFDKLHLRRPNEGALCLSGLTENMQKDSRRTIRELQRERGVEKVIDCELRRRDELVHVVITDDVYLTERLVHLGTVLVLSYSQMKYMF